MCGGNYTSREREALKNSFGSAICTIIRVIGRRFSLFCLKFVTRVKRDFRREFLSLIVVRGIRK